MLEDESVIVNEIIDLLHRNKCTYKDVQHIMRFLEGRLLNQAVQPSLSTMEV